MMQGLHRINYLSAEQAVGQVTVMKEPRLIGDWVLWLEQRPHEGGRTTALIRPWFNQDFIPQELTPSPINLRTRVHGYGGASLTAVKEANQLIVSWIDDHSGALWLQYWTGLDQKKSPLTPIQKPFCLSEKNQYYFADGVIDLQRKRWIGIMESQGRDFLVQFFLDIESQQPEIIYTPKDFIGYLSLSFDSKNLAWIEWQRPSMPWESSQLWSSNFNESGYLINKQLLLGAHSKKDKSISIFQPVWLDSGEIVVAEDSSGWWNLALRKEDLQSLSNSQWHHLWPKNEEIAVPQWVLGMSTIAYSDQKIVGLTCQSGTWHLSIFGKNGSLTSINQPFDDLSGLNAKDSRMVAIASNSFIEPGLLELDLNNGDWKHSLARKPVIPRSLISEPQAIWFKGFNNQLTHCWYYPPLFQSEKSAPLLLRIHSGPTAMSNKGLNLEIQFWTSRGWGVVDVNYSGSSGFGRSYRQRLKDSWGVVDVVDCIEAVKYLINAGKAHENMIAIQGSSAGGFTALSCLYNQNIFSAAACRYPVTDLVCMSQSTHRFEENYLDYLLGSLQKNYHIYDERSPLSNVDKINCPLIIFQGMKDKVVTPGQTRNFVDILKKNKVPVEAYFFENEGHGFRDSTIKKYVLELTDKFFRDKLNF